MKEIELIHQVWKIVREELSPAYNLYLFGSRAKGSNSPYSDFDFGILGPELISHKQLRKIISRISGINTLYSFDVVDILSLEADVKKILTRDMKEIKDGKV